MLAYKKVFKFENGKLIQNTENKIEYIDSKGNKRTKTNPTFKDFAKVGFYPVKAASNIPEFDNLTQTLKENVTLENEVYVISYEVIKRESDFNEERS